MSAMREMKRQKILSQVKFELEKGVQKFVTEHPGVDEKHATKAIQLAFAEQYNSKHETVIAGHWTNENYENVAKRMVSYSIHHGKRNGNSFDHNQHNQDQENILLRAEELLKTDLDVTSTPAQLSARFALQEQKKFSELGAEKYYELHGQKQYDDHIDTSVQDALVSVVILGALFL